MKKIISIFVAVVIMCSVSGCSISFEGSEKTTQQSSLSNNDNKKTTPETTSEPDKKNILKFGETITFNDFEITVNSAEIKDKIQNSQYTEFNPSEGNIYIVVNATVKNIGSDAAKFLSVVSLKKDISTKLTYNDYEFKSTNLLAYSEDLHDTFLNPLSSKTGEIVFEVSADIADLSSLNLVLFNNKEEYRFSLS